MGGSSTNVYVTTVVDDGAAAGFVKSGDKVVAINGTIVTDAVQATAVAKAAVGDVVYSIFRGSEFVMVTVKKATATTKLGVTVANMPAAPDDVAPTRELQLGTTETPPGTLSLTLTKPSKDSRGGVHLADANVGVVATKFVPDSLAEKAGMQAGDILVSINGQPVASTDHAVALLSAAEGDVALVLSRKDEDLLVSEAV